MAEEDRPCRVRRGGAPGFTMIEMIVSLSVLSVAIWLLVSMFRSSVDLANTSTNRLVALQLAEARLQDIVHHPENYLWDLPDSPNAALFNVLQSEDDEPAGVKVVAPSIEPPIERANALHRKVYDSFRWKAHGRFPLDARGGQIPDPAYLDVIVEVRWQEQGRDQTLALTSAVAFDPARLPKLPPPEAEASAEPVAEAE